VCKNGPEKSHSRKKKRQPEKHLLFHHGMNHRTTGCAWQCHHLWGNVDFSIRSRNEEAIGALEDTHFTKNEKSKNEQGESEGNDDRFLQHQRRNMIEWVPEGQTVIQKYYLEVLTKLRERVRKKRPDLWKKKSWILHQDNAPVHKSLAVKQLLADKNIPVLQYPLYSRDLVPCDFCLFPKLKIAFNGTHFQSVDEVK
jgi:hypothetical protein